LIDAAHFDDSEKVKEPIDSGADVNVRDKNGETTLNYAKVRGHADIVKILIAAGATE
jgi:ankyrin repeat protein